MTELLHYIVSSDKLRTFTFLLISSYVVLFVSVIVDMLAAYRRTRLLHIKWVSCNLRETSYKLGKYLFPMVSTSLIDILFLSFLSFPIFTLLVSFFNCFTEWLSVFEKSYDKKEISQLIQITKLLSTNKNNISTLLIELLKQQNKDENKRDQNT